MSQSPSPSPASKSSSNDSSSSSSDISTSGKLNSLVDDGHGQNNFGEWKIQAEIDLLSWDLLKYVTGSDSTPPNIPDLRSPAIHRGTDDGGQEKIFRVAGNLAERQKLLDEAQPWLIKNNIALSKISKSISGHQKYIIRGLKYASQAWNALVDHYQTANVNKATALNSDIHALRCSATSDVAEWLKEIQRLFHSLIDLDPDALSDREFALIVIANLPQTPEWRFFSAGLRQRVNAYNNERPRRPIVSKEFIAAIHEEVYFSSKPVDDSTPQIFNADSKNQKRPRGADSAASSSSPPKRTRTSWADKTCSNPNCGKRGHIISDCVAYGGGNLGNYSAKWKGPWNLHLPPSQRNRSNNSPLPSHPAYTRVMASRAAAQATAQVNALQAQAAQPYPQSTPMPIPYNPPVYYPPLPTSPPQANAVTYYPPTSHYPPPSYPSYPPPAPIKSDSTNPGPFPPFVNQLNVPDPFILATSASPDEPLVASVPIFDQQIAKTDTCYYDSAANRHVFHDRTAFYTYESISPLAVKGFGHDLSTAAIGRGTIHLQGQYGTDTFPIILTNILHIPSARVHLLSGGEFTEKDVKVLLQKPTSFFSFRGTIFLEAFFENRFYRINASILRPRLPYPSVPFCAFTTSSQADFYTA